ncbi:MAG: hypothetical protein AVDCRST_MAG76-897 [uncultured Acidimicrobiales bacterium]|uniref:Uncharacterized protein n=1 Tax=uncultured Acidimicrobiales bacterium TaxID=310071 RepID=A0A6J4HHT6_9ACTN|nr:MAG: hypothetical protein AVDCRST_MAG76-897 [uncultured Acidimicrobiales bacterium]
MHLAAHGFSIDLPRGWEGTISRRLDHAAAQAVNALAGLTPLIAEQVLPVAHLATFGLPANRGDFGSGAVEVMGADDLFIALLEFGPECAGTALFSRTRLPALDPSGFDRNRLQRTLAGQSGHQSWYTINGRALGLYVVLGSHGLARKLVPRANEVLANLQVAA